MNGWLHSLKDPESNASPIVFISGNAQARSHLVFVPGLTDRLLAMPNVLKLLQVRLPESMAVVQCQLRSAGNSFGAFSINDDVEDILAVCKFLIGKGSQSIFLFGHSTGCQDCVTFLKAHSSLNGFIKGLILQAPVSDRHYILSAIPNAESSLKLSLDMIASGKGDHFLQNVRLFGCAITAHRFASLAGRLTEDDLFSTDLIDEELSSVLGHITVPSLWAFSMADEFVPEDIDQKRFSERVAKLISSSTHALIPGADHDLSDRIHANEFVDLMLDFIIRNSSVCSTGQN